MRNTMSKPRMKTQQELTDALIKAGSAQRKVFSSSAQYDIDREEDRQLAIKEAAKIALEKRWTWENTPPGVNIKTAVENSSGIISSNVSSFSGPEFELAISQAVNNYTAAGPGALPVHLRSRLYREAATLVQWNEPFNPPLNTLTPEQKKEKAAEILQKSISNLANATKDDIQKTLLQILTDWRASVPPPAPPQIDPGLPGPPPPGASLLYIALQKMIMESHPFKPSILLTPLEAKKNTAATFAEAFHAALQVPHHKRDILAGNAAAFDKPLKLVREDLADPRVKDGKPSRFDAKLSELKIPTADLKDFYDIDGEIKAYQTNLRYYEDELKNVQTQQSDLNALKSDHPEYSTTEMGSEELETRATRLDFAKSARDRLTSNPIAVIPGPPQVSQRIPDPANPGNFINVPDYFIPIVSEAVAAAIAEGKPGAAPIAAAAVIQYLSTLANPQNFDDKLLATMGRTAGVAAAKMYDPANAATHTRSFDAAYTASDSILQTFRTADAAHLANPNSPDPIKIASFTPAETTALAAAAAAPVVARLANPNARAMEALFTPPLTTHRLETAKSLHRLIEEKENLKKELETKLGSRIAYALAGTERAIKILDTYAPAAIAQPKQKLVANAIGQAVATANLAGANEEVMAQVAAVFTSYCTSQPQLLTHSNTNKKILRIIARQMGIEAAKASKEAKDAGLTPDQQSWAARIAATRTMQHLVTGIPDDPANPVAAAETRVTNSIAGLSVAIDNNLVAVGLKNAVAGPWNHLAPAPPAGDPFAAIHVAGEMRDAFGKPLAPTTELNTIIKEDFLNKIDESIDDLPEEMTNNAEKLKCQQLVEESLGSAFRYTFRKYKGGQAIFGPLPEGKCFASFGIWDKYELTVHYNKDGTLKEVNGQSLSSDQANKLLQALLASSTSPSITINTAGSREALNHFINAIIKSKTPKEIKLNCEHIDAEIQQKVDEHNASVKKTLAPKDAQSQLKNLAGTDLAPADIVAERKKAHDNLLLAQRHLTDIQAFETEVKPGVGGAVTPHDNLTSELTTLNRLRTTINKAVTDLERLYEIPPHPVTPGSPLDLLHQNLRTIDQAIANATDPAIANAGANIAALTVQATAEQKRAQDASNAVNLLKRPSDQAEAKRQANIAENAATQALAHKNAAELIRDQLRNQIANVQASIVQARHHVSQTPLILANARQELTDAQRDATTQAARAQAQYNAVDLAYTTVLGDRANPAAPPGELHRLTNNIANLQRDLGQINGQITHLRNLYALPDPQVPAPGHPLADLIIERNRLQTLIVSAQLVEMNSEANLDAHMGHALQSLTDANNYNAQAQVDTTIPAARANAQLASDSANAVHVRRTNAEQILADVRAQNNAIQLGSADAGLLLGRVQANVRAAEAERDRHLAEAKRAYLQIVAHGRTIRNAYNVIGDETKGEVKQIRDKHNEIKAELDQLERLKVDLDREIKNPDLPLDLSTETKTLETELVKARNTLSEAKRAQVLIDNEDPASPGARQMITDASIRVVNATNNRNAIRDRATADYGRGFPDITIPAANALSNDFQRLATSSLSAHAHAQDATARSRQAQTIPLPAPGILTHDVQAAIKAVRDKKDQELKGVIGKIQQQYAETKAAASDIKRNSDEMNLTHNAISDRCDALNQLLNTAKTFYNEIYDLIVTPPPAELTSLQSEIESEIKSLNDIRARTLKATIVGNTSLATFENKPGGLLELDAKNVTRRNVDLANQNHNNALQAAAATQNDAKAVNDIHDNLSLGGKLDNLYNRINAFRHKAEDDRNKVIEDMHKRHKKPIDEAKTAALASKNTIEAKGGLKDKFDEESGAKSAIALAIQLSRETLQTADVKETIIPEEAELKEAIEKFTKAEQKLDHILQIISTQEAKFDEIKPPFTSQKFAALQAIADKVKNPTDLKIEAVNALAEAQQALAAVENLNKKATNVLANALQKANTQNNARLAAIEGTIQAHENALSAAGRESKAVSQTLQQIQKVSEQITGDPQKLHSHYDQIAKEVTAANRTVKANMGIEEEKKAILKASQTLKENPDASDLHTTIQAAENAANKIANATQEINRAQASLTNQQIPAQQLLAAFTQHRDSELDALKRGIQNAIDAARINFGDAQKTKEDATKTSTSTSAQRAKIYLQCTKAIDEFPQFLEIKAIARIQKTLEEAETEMTHALGELKALPNAKHTESQCADLLAKKPTQAVLQEARILAAEAQGLKEASARIHSQIESAKKLVDKAENEVAQLLLKTTQAAKEKATADEAKRAAPDFSRMTGPVLPVAGVQPTATNAAAAASNPVESKAKQPVKAPPTAQAIPKSAARTMPEINRILNGDASPGSKAKASAATTPAITADQRAAEQRQIEAQHYQAELKKLEEEKAKTQMMDQRKLAEQTQKEKLEKQQAHLRYAPRYGKEAVDLALKNKKPNSLEFHKWVRLMKAALITKIDPSTVNAMSSQERNALLKSSEGEQTESATLAQSQAHQARLTASRQPNPTMSEEDEKTEIAFNARMDSLHRDMDDKLLAQRKVPKTPSKSAAPAPNEADELLRARIKDEGIADDSVEDIASAIEETKERQKRREAGATQTPELTSHQETYHKLEAKKFKAATTASSHMRRDRTGGDSAAGEPSPKEGAGARNSTPHSRNQPPR